MTHTKRLWRPYRLLLVPACLWVVGCGSDGLQRYSLSGTATYDGKPIPNGEVALEPDAAKGNTGPSSVAPIVNGEYETMDEGGHVGGPYIVRIVGFDGVPAGDVSQGTPLFDKPYQVELDLPKEDGTHDFAVP